jgi:uncharacterized protein with HEPN domain
VERNDTYYLQDAMEAIDTIAGYLGSYDVDSFGSSKMAVDAVAYEAAIVGEALNKVSRATKSNNPDLPWREAIANRNLMVHDYGRIKPEKLWQTCTEDLPPLKKQLEALQDRIKNESEI